MELHYILRGPDSTDCGGEHDSALHHPPLVLLHGNGENASCFGAQMDYFGRSRTVVAVDTRGHGLSPRGMAPFRLETFAEDLRELLDTLCIGEETCTRSNSGKAESFSKVSRPDFRKVDLLGFSDGANIAMLFAMKYPGRVNRLVLVGGNLFPRGMTAGVWAQTWAEYAVACVVAWCSAPWGSGSVHRWSNARCEMLRLMACEPHINPRELGCITAPVLVVSGTRDMIRPSHTELMSRSMPNARSAVLEGDHFVVYKRPKEFNRAVEKFLDE